jgi:4-hydroxy-tetrahydrodipicolinate reductase
MKKNMKIAVIGIGKTGSEVIKLLPKEQVCGAYDVDNPVTLLELRKADVIISFVPGVAVMEVLPIIMASGIPAVWGSTGFKWPSDLDNQLKKQHTKWIVSANFSLSMNLIRHCLYIFSQGKQLLDKPCFTIHETHHVHKKDAPSGTALAWQQWLNIDCDIKSHRKGDIKGIHELILATADETISLKHEVHNRAVFAKGAIWAANFLVNHSVPSGLYDFSQIVDQFLQEKIS